MAIMLIRSIIIYLCVLVVIRLMGKRQVGEMQPFEFVEDRIRSILTEQKKIEFLRDYRLNLYEDALKSGAAKRYK